MGNPFTILLKKLFTADYPYCIYCGREYGVDEKLLCCPECAQKLKQGHENSGVFGFTYSACHVFEGPVKSLVHRYKYEGALYLCEKIAMLMKNVFAEENREADAIANVPLHKNKRKQRGFDQSERIAKKLSGFMGIPYIGALMRIKDTVSQTHLTREERIENVRDVFRAREDVAGLNLLLIDDVLTTGSTACECARELMKNGAKSVYILVFAEAL